MKRKPLKIKHNIEPKILTVMFVECLVKSKKYIDDLE